MQMCLKLPVRGFEGTTSKLWEFSLTIRLKYLAYEIVFKQL